MCSSRRIEKCPQSGWGCMGAGATDQCLEGHPYPVQLYGITGHTVRTGITVTHCNLYSIIMV
jgi:hypothetical protein